MYTYFYFKVQRLNNQSNNFTVLSKWSDFVLKAPAGSSISDVASKSSSAQGTSGVNRRTTAGKGVAASGATSGPQSDVGGHTLGGGSTSRPAGKFRQFKWW